MSSSALPEPDPSSVASLDALLWDVAQRYRHEVLAAYKHHDIAGAAVLLIEAVAEGVNTPTRLSRRLVWPPPHVTSTVNRLVERNLVERVPNPHDARSVTIALTPEGLEIVTAAKEVRNVGLGAALADYDAADRECLRENLVCLAEALAISCRSTKGD